ncbi:MAG: GNAT family N-acetyltransferase [Dehalococcoidales bacterium]
MDSLKYTIITSQVELKRAFKIRRTVFIEEQGISASLEMDGNDSSALHMLARKNGRAVGTGRVRFTADKQVKLERMAVLKRQRGTGIGKGIVSFFEKECKKRGIEHITLNAQYSAIDFYKACGFSETGLPFLEAGIKHIRMDKKLH